MIGNLAQVIAVRVLAGAALAAAGGPAPAAKSSAAPAVVPNFALLDADGRYHELRRSGARFVVLFVTGNGCPIARQTLPRLQELTARHPAKDLAVWLLDANPQDDRASIRQEAATLAGAALPVLHDPTQIVARSLGLDRTGEVLLLRTADRALLYRGALDDRLSEGVQRPAARERFLERALGEALEGQPISRPVAPAAGCAITFTGAGAVSYARTVAPLLERKCVGCHSPGNIAPFAFDSYAKVQGWARTMREVLLARRMPPWHADPQHGQWQHDRSLSVAETQTLWHWLEQGAPRGPGADPLPEAARQAAQARWPLGPPDFVVPLPQEEHVPATGVIDYRHPVSDFVMPRDAWVRAAVPRPDNRGVVHHILVFVVYPRDAPSPEHEFVFTSWAPGRETLPFPPGTGKFLPRGARFRFQVHYTTTGKPEIDRSELGLYLAQEPPARRLLTRAAMDTTIIIPPGAREASHQLTSRFTRDTIIYDLGPHMHLRGSWFRYELVLPDGRRETLLSVPHFDFNWQTRYYLAQPRRVPAGSQLIMTGAHDNSADNPANPDARARVVWGEQSFDEMFLGWFTVSDASAGPGLAHGRPGAP